MRKLSVRLILGGRSGFIFWAFLEVQYKQPLCFFPMQLASLRNNAVLSGGGIVGRLGLLGLLLLVELLGDVIDLHCIMIAIQLDCPKILSCAKVCVVVASELKGVAACRPTSAETFMGRHIFKALLSVDKLGFLGS